MDASKVCLNDSQLLLSGSDLESFIYGDLFPPICILGLVGNALNMVVLTSSDFASRSNVLLASLAVCDICFLLLIVPHSLANFKFFAMDYNFRSFYYVSKIHLIGLANWTSAVAIWLMVLVCFERVLGVRRPLRFVAPQTPRTKLSLACVVIFALILTFYNHVAHRCLSTTFCNDTQIIAVCLDVASDKWPGNRPNESPEFLRKYVRWTRLANAFLVVLIPLFLLILLNGMLLFYLKKRSYFSYSNLSRITAKMQLLNQPNLPYVNGVFRRHSDQVWRGGERRLQMDQRLQHRVAVTVSAIVTSFTLTHTPSAVILFGDAILPDRLLNSAYGYDVRTVASFLVVIGKSLNFVVFCLSSSSFRRRLISTLRSKYRSRNPGFISSEKKLSQRKSVQSV